MLLLSFPFLSIFACQRRRLFGTVLNKGVIPERLKELEHYKKQLKDTRDIYREKYSKFPTKSAIAEQAKAKRSIIRTTKWNDYLSKLKSNLSENGGMLRDRHSCRPTRTHTKSQEMRLKGITNLSTTLATHQASRQKHLSLLSRVIDVPDGCITKDNLDMKIDHALRNPKNYNLHPIEFVKKQVDLKESFSQSDVINNP